MEKFEDVIVPPTQEQIPSRELDSMLVEIENLFTESEEKIQKFIAQRIKTLEASADKKNEIDLVSNPLHKGFISKNTGVRRSFMVEPVYIDDPGLYKDFIDTFKQFKQIDQYKDITLRQMLATVIQYTLQRYFGNMGTYADSEENNRQFYRDNSVMTEDGAPIISIREFKGKNMAVCAEKASATQNILSFAGMDSLMILSECNVSGKGEKGAHVFNVTHTEKGYMIFDPTNPVFIKGVDGKVTGARPDLYPISEEDFQKLITGQEIIVEHKDIQIDEKGVQTPIVTKRVYGGVKV